MPPKFLYFDLGKVLVLFDLERMYRQIGEVAGVAPARVREVLIDGGLQRQYELGHISGREFYEAFCRETGTRADYQALRRAGSDFFDLNVSIVPVVAQLDQAGYRLGVLSNTCESHWEHCLNKFSIIRESFCVYALSYQLHAAKPEAAIFQAAADLAGVPPEQVFFTDDTPEHVAGARRVGIDAVQYTSSRALAAELRRRGIRFNY